MKGANKLSPVVECRLHYVAIQVEIHTSKRKFQALENVCESKHVACTSALTRASVVQGCTDKAGQTANTSCGSALCDKLCACQPSTGKRALHVVQHIFICHTTPLAIVHCMESHEQPSAIHYNDISLMSHLACPAATLQSSQRAAAAAAEAAVAAGHLLGKLH